MITYIPRDRLEPHPDNPRKDLGDLSELAASIRKQGLLQNLTVVPHPKKPGMYRIVIGHRRYGASKIAGLSELPCSIDEKMTYPEQIAVMMSENIQRSDLTITEKAGGVQMMMDLGMGVSEVSDRTGISDTTVRRYAKLSALDRKKLKAAENQGATLMQLMEICDIEDAGLKKEALEKAGTNEYQSVMYRVRLARDRSAREPLMTAALSEFAEEIAKEDYNRWYFRDSYRYSDKDALQNIAKMKGSIRPGVKYAYLKREYDVALYEEREKYDAAKEDAKKRAAEEFKARKNAEKGVAMRFREMRDIWMREEFAPEKCPEEAQRFVLWMLTRNQFMSGPAIGGTFDRAFLADREKQPESYTGSIKVSSDEIDGVGANRLLRGMALAAYDRICWIDTTLMDSYSGKQIDPERTVLYDLYRRMEALGYPVCKEERAWLDGTHECWACNQGEECE